MTARKRFSVRANDLALIQRASSVIAELGAELDSRLAHERRPSERLRMLRETTNQLTRTANDAISAYRRAHAAVEAELNAPHGNATAAHAVRSQLRQGRTDMLAALERASQRYAWSSWPSRSAAPHSEQRAEERVP